ncbi:MAG: phasin family protein [Alphaproteobacteria bacterium]|nr:phasin family protein [Alphaproteobacteria bacterium]
MAHKANHAEFLKDTMKKMSMDRQSRLESHKKKVESITEASKKAADIMKNLSQLQQQYMKEAFESMTNMMKDMMSHGATQEGMQKHTENLKKHLSHAIDHGTTVASVISKTHKDAFETVKQHVAEHMKATAEKKSAKATKH